MSRPAFPDQLTGEGFLLRRLQEEDAEWYVSARDVEIFRWTTEKRGLTVAETAETIRRINAGTSVPCLAVVDQNTGNPLGNLALALDGEPPTDGEVMYWLAAEGRGRGIASRAVNLLCDWAFENLGLAKITLKTLHGNERSQRVAERAGFHMVGEDAEYRIYKKCGNRK